MAASSTPGGGNATRSSSDGHVFWNLIIVVAVVVAVILLLTLLPIPHPFSTTLASGTASGAKASYNFPGEASVRGSWSVSSGSSVQFSIQNAAGNVIYSSTGSSGSFSFVASDSPYTLSVLSVSPQSTSVSGSYSSPIF
jgi:hypothetical protein